MLLLFAAVYDLNWDDEAFGEIEAGRNLLFDK